MNFEDVVKMIKESNAKVDEVLKAARLERHERAPMEKEMLAMILNYVIGTISIIGGFAALYMIIYYMGGEVEK